MANPETDVWGSQEQVVLHLHSKLHEMMGQMSMQNLAASVERMCAATEEPASDVVREGPGDGLWISKGAGQGWGRGAGSYRHDFGANLT